MGISVQVANSLTIQAATPRDIAGLQEALDFTYSTKEEDEITGKMRRVTNTYPVVQRVSDRTWEVPFGALPIVRELLPHAGYTYNTTWHAQDPAWPALQLAGQDRLTQEEALEDLYAAHAQQIYGCCLIAPCGAGKTRMGARLIGQIRRPTLVVVHTRELADQWAARLQEAMPGLEIGLIGDGKHILKPVTIGYVQTLVKVVGAIANDFSMVIFDECHHVPARTFTEVANTLNATVKLGLTATKRRGDGMHPLLYATLGPIVSRVHQKDLIEDGDAMPLRVEQRHTRWESPIDPRSDCGYTSMMTALVKNRARNALVVEEIVRQIDAGRHILVLSPRVAHLKDLCGMTLVHRSGSAQLLHGKLTPKERRLAMERMVAGFPATFATTSIAAEALDAPALDCLIWAAPGGRDERTAQQASGRIQRTREGKPTPLVIEFLDDVGVLARQLRERMRVYRRVSGGATL